MNLCIARFILLAGVAWGQQSLSFEAASIKPNKSSETTVRFHMQDPGRFGATNVTIRRLIEVAYDIYDFQLSAGPKWISSDRFDVDATGNFRSTDDSRQMIQTLLRERCNLLTHNETKEMTTYSLVQAKAGPKLKEASANASTPAGAVITRRGLLMAHDVPVAALLNSLSNILAGPVVDRTGLDGRYDLKIEWTPDELQVASFNVMGVPQVSSAPIDPGGPTLFTAFEEQLGLKIESHKEPGKVLMIDRVEKPSEN